MRSRDVEHNAAKKYPNMADEVRMAGPNPKAPATDIKLHNFQLKGAAADVKPMFEKE